MKNIIWLLIFCFAQDISCNDVIFSKLGQKAFKLKDVRIQLMSYDKDYANIFEIKAFKYNRTTTAHNCTINLKVEVGNKPEVVLQANKFYSNEYRRFPIRFQVNLKKSYQANAMGLRDVTKCGNVTTFDLHKDITYRVCNFVLDETRFPPLMPVGKYRIDITVMYLNKEISLIYIYNEVYIPIEYPKR